MNRFLVPMITKVLRQGMLPQCLVVVTNNSINLQGNQYNVMTIDLVRSTKKKRLRTKVRYDRINIKFYI